MTNTTPILRPYGFRAKLIEVSCPEGDWSSVFALTEMERGEGQLAFENHYCHCHLRTPK